MSDPDDPDVAPGPSAGGRASGAPGPADRALQAALGGVRAGVRIAAVPMVLTGLAALALGVAAWRFQQPAVEIVSVVSVVAVATPVWVARRLTALTRALDDPRAVVGQAGDLLTQVRTSPDVGRIVGTVTRSRRARRSGGGGWGLLGSLRTLRGALDAVQPDAVRHDRLVHLRPEQLRRVWFAALLALWAWLASAVVAAAAVLALVLRLV